MSKELKKEILSWMVEIKSPQVFPFLETCYRDESDVEVKEHIIYLFEKFPGPEGKQWLAEVIFSEREPDILKGIAFSVYGGLEAVSPPDLHTLFKKVSDKKHKEAILYGLFHKISASNTAGDREILKKIVFSGDEDHSFRRRAFIYYSRLEGVTVSELVEVYKKIDEKKLKREILEEFKEHPDFEEGLLDLI